MTQEEKAKSYDEAKSRMSRAFNSNRCTIGFMNEIFPELKESEDEKARKELIAFLEESLYLGYPDETWDSKGLKRWIAWLEKQGENKPTENVEIKFCEGDKVVSNQDGKVYTVGTAFYIAGDNICLHDTNGDHKWTNKDDLNRNYHLWTIADAKDGDVLCYHVSATTFFLIGIFKRVAHKDELWGGTYRNYAQYGGYGSVENYTLQVVLGNDELHHCGSIACPATKEQRDLLFQKMKEAGYEWDSEKKELRKIEQNPAESTKDYNDIDPHFGIPVEDLMSTDKTESKFKAGNWYQCTKDFFGKGVTFDKNTAYYCAKDGCLQNEYGCHIAIVEDLYDNFKLWTIKDAKDGDVLTANVQRGELGYDEYPFRYIPITFIYRKTNKDDYIHSYCDMLCVYGVLNPSYRIFSEYFIKDIYPATEEQRELLFQKIKEEGCEWDSENKEVKRIEPKKVNANKVINWVNPDKVIEWLKNTIKKKAENYGVYNETCLILPYNSIEDLINDFKEDFGL